MAQLAPHETWIPWMLFTPQSYAGTPRYLPDMHELAIPSDCKHRSASDEHGHGVKVAVKVELVQELVQSMTQAREEWSRAEKTWEMVPK